MARRSDIRIALDPALGRVIASAADAEAWVRLEKARGELAGAVQGVKDALSELPAHVLQTFAETAARSACRSRGKASIEVDPDGALVLVFSYGGRPTPSLARDATPAKAWATSLPSLAEAKAAALAAHVDISDCGRSTGAIMDKIAARGRSGTRARPGGGFIKTAPAVSAQRQVEDLDHLFDDETTPESSPVAAPVAAPVAVAKRPPAGRLTALAAASVRVDLGSILDSD
jgi:hypothetical protein